MASNPIRERQRMGYTECQALYAMNPDPQFFVLNLFSNWSIQNWPRAVEYFAPPVPPNLLQAPNSKLVTVPLMPEIHATV